MRAGGAWRAQHIQRGGQFGSSPRAPRKEGMSLVSKNVSWPPGDLHRVMMDPLPFVFLSEYDPRCDSVASLSTMASNSP